MESVAYHEAGHAVMYVNYKRSFVHVTIVRGESSLGHLLSTRLGDWFRPDIEMTPKAELLIDRHVLLGMAGMAAEKRFRGRRDWQGSGSDIRNAMNLASYLHPDERVLGKYIDFKVAEADGLMESPIIWAQVEAVAAGLLELKHLSSARVRRICRATIEDGTRIDELSVQWHAKRDAESEEARSLLNSRKFDLMT